MPPMYGPMARDATTRHARLGLGTHRLTTELSCQPRWRALVLLTRPGARLVCSNAELGRNRPVARGSIAPSAWAWLAAQLRG